MMIPKCRNKRLMRERETQHSCHPENLLRCNQSCCDDDKPMTSHTGPTHDNTVILMSSSYEYMGLCELILQLIHHRLARKILSSNFIIMDEVLNESIKSNKKTIVQPNACKLHKFKFIFGDSMVAGALAMTWEY